MRLATLEGDAGTKFDLEPSPVRGEVPAAVREELVALKVAAKDAAAGFAAAIEAQAEKYGVSRPALRRYITAMAGDKLEALEAENESLAQLLGLED